jgi:hypothetical protein
MAKVNTASLQGWEKGPRGEPVLERPKFLTLAIRTKNFPYTFRALNSRRDMDRNAWRYVFSSC